MVPAYVSLQQGKMHDPKPRSDAAIPEAAPEASRTLRDAEGQHWRVYEKPYDALDRRSGLSLIFASEGAVRRVRNYPADWATLPDDELMKLSWKA